MSTERVISVAVPDAHAAHDLERQLARLAPSRIEHDGEWRVDVADLGDTTLATLLSTVDRWLGAAGIPSALVTVAGREYEMRADGRS